MGLGIYSKFFKKSLPTGKLTEFRTSFHIPENIQTFKHNHSVNHDTLRQILMINPKTVVDVGAGDGFYAKLIRYYLPSCFITAIEKNKIYLEKFSLEKFYDKIIVDDVTKAIKTVSGDLIIFGDVLEHLEKSDMTDMINESLNRFQYVIINSPLGFQPQEHEYEEERHRCGIDFTDFQNKRVLEFRVFDGNMFNCLLIGNSNRNYDMLERN